MPVASESAKGARFYVDRLSGAKEMDSRAWRTRSVAPVDCRVRRYEEVGAQFIAPVDLPVLSTFLPDAPGHAAGQH